MNDDLVTALTAFACFRTPARIRSALLEPGAVQNAKAELAPQTVDEIVATALRLQHNGVQVLLTSNTDFPASLAGRGHPPALYLKGDRSLLLDRCLSVSGARDASPEATTAASAIGKLAAKEGLTLIAGAARGIDRAASDTAAQLGGRVISVLAEGIDNASDDEATPPPSGTLIVSQFSPDARWSIYNAMSRNRTICALGVATVVVQAGTKGGSLAAGREALKLERPLLVLTFTSGTPAGNQILIDEGGIPVSSLADIRSTLSRILEQPEQTTLI